MNKKPHSGVQGSSPSSPSSSPSSSTHQQPEEEEIRKRKKENCCPCCCCLEHQILLLLLLPRTLDSMPGNNCCCCCSCKEPGTLYWKAALQLLLLLGTLCHKALTWTLTPWTLLSRLIYSCNKQPYNNRQLLVSPWRP